MANLGVGLVHLKVTVGSRREAVAANFATASTYRSVRVSCGTSDTTSQAGAVARSERCSASKEQEAESALCVSPVHKGETRLGVWSADHRKVIPHGPGDVLSETCGFFSWVYSWHIPSAAGRSEGLHKGRVWGGCACEAREKVGRGPDRGWARVRSGAPRHAERVAGWVRGAWRGLCRTSYSVSR
jgi:hypothetical protein